MQDRQSKIAVFVDADNFPAKLYNQALRIIGKSGKPLAQKVFGNWTKPSLVSWCKVAQDNGMSAVQCFDMVKGKNASDIKLVVDAMSYVSENQVDKVALLTSDCDFTPLAIFLREKGLDVIVITSGSYHEALKAASSEFHSISEIAKASTKVPDVVVKPKSPSSSSQCVSYLRVNSIKTKKSLKSSIRMAINYAVILDEVDNALKQFKHNAEGWFWITSSCRYLERIKSVKLTDIESTAGGAGRSFVERSGLFELKIVGNKKAARRISDVTLFKNGNKSLERVFPDVYKMMSKFIKTGSTPTLINDLEKLVNSYGYVGENGRQAVDSILDETLSITKTPNGSFIKVPMFAESELKHDVRKLSIAIESMVNDGCDSWKVLRSKLSDGGFDLMKYSHTGCAASVIGLTECLDSWIDVVGDTVSIMAEH